MLATAMLAGCQDAPIPGDNTENYFSFSAGVAKTRTEAIVEDDGLTFRWTDRDEVGIYGIQDDRSLGDNYAYTAYPDSEDAANCVFRFSTYGQAYQNVAAGSEFYAYPPQTRVRRVRCRSYCPPNNSNSRLARRTTLHAMDS